MRVTSLLPCRRAPSPLAHSQAAWGLGPLLLGSGCFRLLLLEAHCPQIALAAACCLPLASHLLQQIALAAACCPPLASHPFLPLVLAFCHPHPPLAALSDPFRPLPAVSEGMVLGEEEFRAHPLGSLDAAEPVAGPVAEMGPPVEDCRVIVLDALLPGEPVCPACPPRPPGLCPPHPCLGAARAPLPHRSRTHEALLWGAGVQGLAGPPHATPLGDCPHPAPSLHPQDRSYP